MEKNKYIWIIALVICSLLTNFVFLGINNLISSDGAVYSQIGKNLASGEGYTYNGGYNFIWPPMTQLLLGAGYYIFGVKEIVGNGVIIVISALCIIPLYLIAERHFNTKIAILSCLFFIASNQIISLSTTILSDIVGIFFFLCFFYYFDKESYSASAVFLGLMGLTRRTAFVIAIVVLGYLAFKRDWKHLILFPLIFACVMAPYHLFVYHATGDPFYDKAVSDFSYGGQVGVFASEPWSNEVSMEYTYYSGADSNDKITILQFILTNIPFLMKKCFMQFVGIFIHIIPTILNPILMIPLVLGICAMPNKERKRLLLFTIAFILLFSATYTSVRHLAIIIPFLVIFAAYGFYHLCYKLGVGSFNEYIFIAGILIIMLTPSIFSLMFTEPNYPEYRDAATWMHDNVPHDARVLSRKPQIPYYAGGITWSHFPMTLNNTLQFAHQYDYQYIIFDEAYTAVYRPEMIDLIEKNEVEGLELVYSDNTPLHRVKIWKISFYNCIRDYCTGKIGDDIPDSHEVLHLSKEEMLKECFYSKGTCLDIFSKNETCCDINQDNIKLEQYHQTIICYFNEENDS